MVVLFYALEAEVLANLDAPDRGKFLIESAQAYRARSQCLEKLGRTQAAQADLKRASSLESEGRKLDKARQEKGARRSVQLTNGWSEPVELIIDGVRYRLEVGEQRTIPLATSSVSYELQAGGRRRAGTLEAGRTYAITSAVP
jgi:hypothetical protein